MQLRKKSERLATASKATARKTRDELKSQVAKLRESIAAGKVGAQKMRSDLALVRWDLADASHHLSHALHVDKAIDKVEKAIAKKRGAGKKS